MSRVRAGQVITLDEDAGTKVLIVEYDTEDKRTDVHRVATEDEARILYRKLKDLHGSFLIQAYTADRKVS